MKNLPTIQLTKTTSLLMGFSAGFVFLIALFLGLDIATDAVVVVSIFFLTIIVVLLLLLSGDTVTKPNS